MEKPFDITQITQNLYISEYPHKEHIKVIKELGINMVISMTWIKIPKILESDSTIHVKVFAIDSFLTPIPMRSLFKGVEAALPLLNSGQKILVHCKRGVHRSVAMCACILIACGYSSSEAIALIKDKRKVAKPETWYIKRRIIDFEKEWLRIKN